MPRSAESLSESPPIISTVKSGASSPAATSVVSASGSAFRAPPPQPGSSRIAIRIAAINASISHSCPLLFFFAIFIILINSKSGRCGSPRLRDRTIPHPNDDHRTPIAQLASR